MMHTTDDVINRGSYPFVPLEDTFLGLFALIVARSEVKNISYFHLQGKGLGLTNIPVNTLLLLTKGKMPEIGDIVVFSFLPHDKLIPIEVRKIDSFKKL